MRPLTQMPQFAAETRFPPWIVFLGAMVIPLIYLPTLGTRFDFIDDGNLVYPAPPMAAGERVHLVWQKIVANYEHLGPFRPVLWVHWEIAADLFRGDAAKWHLARLLWLTTLVDGAIHREWILSMGRRQAPARLAHLLCELFLRLQAVGKVDGMSFSLPLTQAQMGDVLGVSSVHMNRTLQELRRDGMIKWQGPIVTIKDWQRLKSFAEFDAAYLSLERAPR